MTTPERATETLTYLRTAIEHAPLDPGKLAPDIKGWIAEGGLYLCALCAGRIMARGCRVPCGEVVWNGKRAPEPCCLCGK